MTAEVSNSQIQFSELFHIQDAILDELVGVNDIDDWINVNQCK